MSAALRAVTTIATRGRDLVDCVPYPTLCVTDYPAKVLPSQLLELGAISLQIVTEVNCSCIAHVAMYTRFISRINDVFAHAYTMYFRVCTMYFRVYTTARNAAHHAATHRRRPAASVFEFEHV